MTLYLMRHGETDYNHQRRFYGSIDAPLNQRGMEQSIEIGRQMRSYPVSYVYVSGLQRAQQTADLIFETGPPREVCIGLNEKDFGLWEGLTADEIQQKFPSVWQAWLEEPLEVVPPAAEAFSAFRDRVIATVKELQLSHRADDVAIVGHLGVLRLIYQELVDKEAVFWDIDFPQGQVLCYEKAPDGSVEWYPLSDKERR